MLKIQQSVINLLESYLNRQCKKCKQECYVTHCDICEVRMLLNLIEKCSPTKDERS